MIRVTDLRAGGVRELFVGRLFYSKVYVPLTTSQRQLTGSKRPLKPQPIKMRPWLVLRRVDESHVEIM